MCRVVATFSERRSIVAESLPIDRQRGAVSEPFEMIAARDAADEVELIAETEPVVGQKCVGALRSDGEEKFVVFAAGYGGFEIDGSRDALGIDFGTYAGLVQDMPQVGGDAVRDVHHGVHFRTFAEPDAFGDLRGGVAVDLCQRGVVPSGQDIAQSGARLSQRTADGDQVAGACVAAPFDMAVGSGMIDCGFGLVGKFIQPIENGLNMVITSGMHTGCTKLLVRADSGIESVADLKGRTIGVSSLASSEAITAKRALNAAGVDISADGGEVTFAVYSTTDQPVALMNGAVDAISTPDPVATNAENEYGLKVLLDTAVTEPYASEYCCVSFVSRSEEHTSELQSR